jgi:hypothetical protein
MTADATRVRMKRSDTVGMLIWLALGAGLIIWTVVQSVARLGEVLGGGDVRVFAQFAGTMADAPIGPDGAPVAVELDTAYLIAPELPVASIWALVIAEVIVVLTVATVVTCLLLLMRSVLRGRVFSRTNTVLVSTASVAGFAGVVLAPFFGNMGANGAFAWISERTFDNVIMSADVTLIFGIAFIALIAVTTFTVGDRLQRETEGLV